jgi:septal ring factor EnvC (AmiA/AmiB activator)
MMDIRREIGCNPLPAMLDPNLKELIQRNRFHLKPVLEVVPLLPETEADAAALRELREKVREQKSTIRETHDERSQLLRELGQVYTELKALRKEQAKAPAPA